MSPQVKNSPEWPGYNIRPRPFISSLFGVFWVVMVFVVSAFFLIFLRIIFAPRKYLDAVVYACNPVLVWSQGVTVKVFNREKFYDPSEACIIISNHSSLVDIPSVYMAASGRLRMLAKRELFWIPFIGWGMTAAKFVGVTRGKRSSGENAQKKIGKRLSEGYQFYIAPEGTRSPTGRLLPFKPGAFRIAKIHKVPIVVLALEEPWKLLPKTDLLARKKGNLKATFLGKISTVSAENRDLTAVDLMNIARQMYLDHGIADAGLTPPQS